MQNHHPVVSIIMPVRNGSNYLVEALKFIRAQNVDMEIIVVDDGSTDDSAKIAQEFGCIVLKHEVSKGLVSSKNTALKVAKGKYVMFHDHDDFLELNSLEPMVKELQEDKEISAVMTQLRDFISPELNAEQRKKILPRLEPYSGLFSGAILIRREVFDKIGLFSDNIKAGDIIEWNNKMNANKLVIKRLNFVTSNRRIHNSNYGRTDKEREYKDYAAILRSKLRG